MMWNALVSALLLRASIVMLDGDPTWPDLLEQWRLAEELRPTMMGVSPAYLMACRKAGLLPGRELDLSSIRDVLHGRLAAAAEGYTWVYEHLPPQTLLNNGSGGTDVCTGIVEGCLAQPVYEGEISGAALGVDAKAFDADGNVVVGELGELVITSPMPSMPVALWGDTDGSRYHERLLRPVPGRLAPGRLDQVHRARQLRDHRPLGRDAQPRRRAARHRRVLRGRSTSCRRSPTRSSSISRTTPAAPASCCCSSSRPRARPSTRR